MSEEIIKEDSMPPKKKNFFHSTRSKIILSLVIVIITIVAVKGIAVAKHFQRFIDGPHAFIIEKISKDLDLNSEQKARVESISEQIKAKMESKKLTHENMLGEFSNEFKKDNIDRNKLNELADKEDLDKQEMKNFIMDKIIEFHSILTPDQRSKAVESMKDFQGRFHEKMKNFKDRQD
ncbi:MAG: Spy/CpxP family protein refolding chaperone [Ignavibacteria bacterium]